MSDWPDWTGPMGRWTRCPHGDTIPDQRFAFECGWCGGAMLWFCDWCREPIAQEELHVLYDGKTTYGFAHQSICANSWYRAIEEADRLLVQAFG